MKSIDLSKLSLAAPPKLRDTVMDPDTRTQTPVISLAVAGGRTGKQAVARLVSAGSELVGSLGIGELLCSVDGNQDEKNARAWVDGLPAKRDRTRSLLGRLMKELKERHDFAGLIRLQEDDIALWLPALARRAVKYELPATLCMSREPLLLVTFEPAGVICCYSPEEDVLKQVKEVAPSLGLAPLGGR
jgi:hypothetical protein